MFFLTVPSRFFSSLPLFMQCPCQNTKRKEIICKSEISNRIHRLTVPLRHVVTLTHLYPSRRQGSLIGTNQGHVFFFWHRCRSRPAARNLHSTLAYFHLDATEAPLVFIKTKEHSGVPLAALRHFFLLGTMMMPRLEKWTQSFVQEVSLNGLSKSAASGIMSSAVPRTPSEPSDSTTGYPLVCGS